MRAELKPRRIADDVFEFEAASAQEAQALATQLRALKLSEDVVAGLRSVCVRFLPQDLPALKTAFLNLTSAPLEDELPTETIELSVQYGGDFGPDLPNICKALALSETAFIDLHTGRDHRVEMIGFTPGFSYISGLPDQFEVPRRSDPRPRVPAGAIGISSRYTGIYALSGPGGWPLVGQVQEALFSPDAEQPFKLLPGHWVRFKAV